MICKDKDCKHRDTFGGCRRGSCCKPPAEGDKPPAPRPDCHWLYRDGTSCTLGSGCMRQDCKSWRG